MERLLDIAAKELTIDRLEIRRRNFIPPDQFPYSNEIMFQDFTPLTYDSGNYEPALDRAMELIGYEEFTREEQPRRESAGERVGIAVVNYVEGTGIGPYEGAKVTVEASGKVSVATGVGTQGQGHYTSFAQVVAEQIGVEPSPMSTLSPVTPTFSIGARAPSQAGGQSSPATPCTPPRPRYGPRF